jgi:hypothetical protein
MKWLAIAYLYLLPGVVGYAVGRLVERRWWRKHR